VFRSFDISPEPHPVWTNSESYAKSKFGHALRLAPPTPSHPEIRSLEGIPVSAAAAAYVSVLPTTQAAPQAANRPLRTTGSRAPLPAARRAPPALPAPRAPRPAPLPTHGRSRSPAPRMRPHTGTTPLPPRAVHSLSAGAVLSGGGRVEAELGRRACAEGAAASLCGGCVPAQRAPAASSRRRARARGRRRGVS